MRRGTGGPGEMESGVAAAAGGPLLRPTASCPRCGSRPALRATEALRDAVGGRPLAERLATYQCQRRACGAVYPLTVGNIADAS
jgi:hypothetical protein